MQNHFRVSINCKVKYGFERNKQYIWSLFFILYYDNQMHNYFTNNHIPTCFDTIKIKNKQKMLQVGYSIQYCTNNKTTNYFNTILTHTAYL